MLPFSLDSLRTIEIIDKSVLEPLILSLEPHSCEMNFLNLYAWTRSHSTKFTIYAGLPWVWFPPEKTSLLPRAYIQTGVDTFLPGDYGEDCLLFPGGLNQELWPSPQLLQSVSRGFRKHGYAGIIRNVPTEYLQAFPEVRELFVVQKSGSATGEYIYSIANLVALRGRRLAKKKNLLSQFLSAYPEHEIKILTAEQIPACQELSQQWYSSRTMDNFIRLEKNALEQTLAAATELSLEGFCLYVNTTLIAFALFTRLNSNTCDEHFEKTDISYKGSAQFLNQQMMQHLLARYEFVNREQDLGIKGLRQAKKSYEPIEFRQNYQLTLNAALQ